jgi:hypothetical protein
VHKTLAVTLDSRKRAAGLCCAHEPQACEQQDFSRLAPASASTTCRPCPSDDMTILSTATATLLIASAQADAQRKAGRALHCCKMQLPIAAATAW